MQKLIENHTKKLLDGNSSNAENPEGNPNLDKGKRQEIVKQMKDEVPVVLLNQWLEIQPEKSGFAKVDNCMLNADEYSVYSDDTYSQALSIKSKNILKDIAKRNSMMVNNSNQIRDQILKLDPNLHAALTRKQTVNLNKDLNKSKNDDSAREIECISELSSDQTESFIDASPMPSAMERSRKNSINISTFRRNEELGKIEEKNEESYSLQVEEREIPFNTKDSPAKQKPTTLLKETNSTPYKLQPFLEAKCAPDTTKRFFQTEKKSEIRITRKSKIGLTPPQPSESLLLRQRRLTNTFGQKHTTKNLLKGRKINELLDIDRYMQIRKFDKGIRRIRPSNSFIPMPEKEVYSFDRGKFNLPNFDKKKPQKHNTSHSQTKSHKKMMKSIKGFKQRIHEYGMNAKTLK